MNDNSMTNISEFLFSATSSQTNYFTFCRSCQRSFNYITKDNYHTCCLKISKTEQTHKNAIRKQNLDLSKHCGVIIGPSGIPCMRSLTCKSHSMASKRAIKYRLKDFDVLLNEYLQTHPPKNIPKTISAAVNLDLMTNDDKNSEIKLANIEKISPFKVKKSAKIYTSLTRRNLISKYRSIFSFLDRDRSNKTTRTL